MHNYPDEQIIAEGSKQLCSNPIACFNGFTELKKLDPCFNMLRTLWIVAH